MNASVVEPSKWKIVLRATVPDSYRVSRVASGFDDPLTRTTETTLEFDPAPARDDRWRLGLIVGPSGSGKTTIARLLYPDALYAPLPWSERALVDDFAPRRFDEITSVLDAVGLSSRRLWVRPYSTLSGGERFRCDLARALLDAPGDLVVFDEYASLVDSATARAASIALRKGFDRGTFRKKLIALACRDDVEEYLEPDWTLDASTGALRRGRLRRRPIALTVRRADRDAWTDFKAHHYLTSSLNRSSRCYLGAIESGLGLGVPVDAVFGAIMQSEGRKGRKRVHRLVVKPEFQGVGLGGAFLDALAELVFEEGSLLEIATGSSLLARRLARSARWKLTRVYPCGRTQRHQGKPSPGSFGRAIASFIYAPPNETFRDADNSQ